MITSVEKSNLTRWDNIKARISVDAEMKITYPQNILSILRISSFPFSSFRRIGISLIKPKLTPKVNNGRSRLEDDSIKLKSENSGEVKKRAAREL